MSLEAKIKVRVKDSAAKFSQWPRNQEVVEREKQVFCCVFYCQGGIFIIWSVNVVRSYVVDDVTCQACRESGWVYGVMGPRQAIESPPMAND